ncbi:N-acetylglucosamine-6-phosphate deacetylase [Clostridium sp. OS1-26]|uniref:N-acetylglucosamine-6-phosphate deacetylase n=1 Tax=Clostridium sp. OS1-26 TaxID=3070681 RepID=UPI0027E03B8D|nr:N-acetylglucosamine-6-phosphate deacetylase [Clostridium sp. OS1-26]WML36929.1 N-acetylglucosamine-6-phosphate deacetylase [Clostridium sp. OS1-26]
MRAIINGRVVLENCILEDKVVLFDTQIKGLINRIEFEKNVNGGSYDEIDIIDAKGSYVSPGFIDLHIHGSGGRDAMDGELEDLKIISQSIAQNGVTGFLPTTMTMSKEKIYKALDNIREGMKLDLGGAKVLGAHMEGPFINPKYKGAQKEDYIIEPNYNFINGYEDVIKIITLAPEKDNNSQFIRSVKENTNIVLSIGHSDATYEEAMESIEKGVSHATHLFNAMSPLNHRKPGVIGAVFNSNINCELIADKIHVHPGVFQTVVNIKGVDKVLLITDSMRAGCMKDGVSELGGQKVIVKDNSARLEDGTLAGSILTLNKAVKNMVENTNLNIYQAISMVSLNSAKDIGISDRKGSIEEGKDADIVIFDEEYNVSHTIVEGKTVFTKI